MLFHLLIIKIDYGNKKEEKSKIKRAGKTVNISVFRFFYFFIKSQVLLVFIIIF